MLKIKIITIFVVFLAVVGISYSQQEMQNFNFDQKVKKQTVKKIGSLLNDNYVFPESAKAL